MRLLAKDHIGATIDVEIASKQEAGVAKDKRQ